MISIEYFIAGMLFAEFGIPILEGIAALFLTLLEVGKGRLTLIITKYNKQIRDIADKEEVSTNAIGFRCDPVEYDEDEEDEDD